MVPMFTCGLERLNLSPAAAKDRRERQNRPDDDDDDDEMGERRRRRADWWARVVRVVRLMVAMVKDTAEVR